MVFIPLFHFSSASKACLLVVTIAVGIVLDPSFVAVVGWLSVICEVSILLPKNRTIGVVVVGSSASGLIVRAGAVESTEIGLSDIISSSEVDRVCIAVVCTTTAVCLAFCLVCTSNGFHGWAARFFARNILMASNLATGAKVSSKSIPSSCEYPFATNLALFLMTVPFSSDLFLNTHLHPTTG
ncbi:hypothetical protein AKJ16_DCAP09961 [Drosera capensis]